MHRPRLEALLGEGRRRPVTLVSGPPGAGKTTLLASWAMSSGCPTAWLTLNACDNQRGRLATLSVEALRRAGLVDGRAGRPPLSPEHVLDGAFDQILAAGSKCVLVLEDVQELRSRAALRTLSYLLEHAPTSLDVVLSTRADPPISWQRLQLYGRVGEIRHAELAFDEAEAGQLIAAHAVTLSPQDVRTLWSRTTGWAAGLRLAACTLQSEPDPHRFVSNAAATQAAMSDYLLSEVLMRQDAAAQDFLLRTSVAERLTVGLAVALTGDEHSEQRLLGLVRRGLFVVEMDDQQGYRYHALFRELLQARLQQARPELFDGLHGLAAVWFMAQGLADEAEAHARTAGEWAMAGQLMLRQWLESALGDAEPSPDARLAGVPPDVALNTPELAVVAAIEACRLCKREEADLYRGALERMTPLPGTFRRRGRQERAALRTARLLFDITYGWVFGANDRSQEAVAVTRELTATEEWTPRLRHAALLAQAEQDVDDGALDQARQTLSDLAYQGDHAWHWMLSSAMLALVDAAVGDVRAAEERLVTVRAMLEERPAHPAGAFAQLASAVCAALRNGQRSDALSPSGDTVEWSSRSLRYVDRAVRAAATGRTPFFVSLDATTARHPLAERVLVALGVLEVVDAHGRPIPVGGDGERAVAEARRLLGEGAVERSASALSTWLDSAEPRHPRTLIEAGVLAALAASRREDPGVARRRLGAAFELAVGTGITAPLFEHAADLRVLLENSLDGLGAQVTSTFEVLDRLLQHADSSEPVESLTDREIEVLQRLPTLMSNTEIAHGMHLSVNTVKTHLKAVYRKLGVDGRREAVLRGRELQLL